jgi:hypothetical protein
MEEQDWKPDENLRRIVCAANWYCYADDHPEVHVVLGPRHWDETMRDQYRKMKYDLPHHLWKQGFIDNFGKLHTREEALVIARRMNQVVRELDYKTKQLFSEMLY